MSQYASQTAVSEEKSRAEIEKTLKRYRAEGFAYGIQKDRAIIMFEMSGRRIKFLLPYPELKDFERTPSGQMRHKESNIEKQYEQAIRQRWRALALAVKAKLEAVESGIATFEEEFMAHIVLPNGKTVGEVMIPQIESSYQSKKMPPLLGFQG